MVDQEKVKRAARLMLEGIGEDPDREGLRETPERIARMYGELFAGRETDGREEMSKVFSVLAGQMVLEKDISFYSMCEHHMLPFFGKAHIAYLPQDKVVGLSKLARTVEIYARRLQLQERMTQQIADAVSAFLAPKGVMVVTEAEHMCMTMRGVRKPGSRTVSAAVKGAFETDDALREQFFRMLRLSARTEG